MRTHPRNDDMQTAGARERVRAVRRAATLLALPLLVLALSGGGCDESERTPGDATGPRVEVIPDEATLATGQVLDFDVLIDGTDGEGVTWDIVAEPEPGSITGDGVYTAPDTVPVPATFLIEARVQAAFDTPGFAEVTIVDPPSKRWPEE